MINPNDPAFPCESDLHGKPHPGLSIRAELAARILQGIAANTTIIGSPQTRAKWAVEDADALIEELNNPNATHQK